jgi:hypothetical protein
MPGEKKQETLPTETVPTTIETNLTDALRRINNIEARLSPALEQVKAAAEVVNDLKDRVKAVEAVADNYAMGKITAAAASMIASAVTAAMRDLVEYKKGAEERIEARHNGTKPALVAITRTPHLDEGVIERLVQEELTKAAGLLTREAATYLVYKNLGIGNEEKQTPPQRGEKGFTNLGTITRGMKNLKVKGQLLDDPITREVDTRVGPKTVSSFRLDDGMGETRISLWGRETDVAKLIAGTIVSLEGLNADAPFDGLPQLSGGKWAKIHLGDAPASTPPPKSGGYSGQIENPGGPATDKQKKFMDDLKIRYDAGITKIEASNLIDQKKKK